MAQAFGSSQEAAEGWFVVGASVVGTSHIAEAKPCQDAHGFRLLPGGCLLAAVSDGAGSAEMSDVGSRLATEAFITFTAESLENRLPSTDEEWAILMRASFQAAADSLTEEATKRCVPVRQLGATLLATIIHSTRSVIASVGDCVAVSKHDAGNWLLPVIPPRGEYVNETTFLTTPDWQQTLQISFLDCRPEHLILFSDGLTCLALNRSVPAPHTPFFASLFAFIANRALTGEALDALQQFLNSERVNDRTDDDKTLLLAWRETSWRE